MIKLHRLLLASLLSLGLFASARAAVETYNIDPVHSSAGFTLRHMVSKFTGSFTIRNIARNFVCMLLCSSVSIQPDPRPGISPCWTSCTSSPRHRFNPTRPSARNIAADDPVLPGRDRQFQSNPTLGQEYRWQGSPHCSQATPFQSNPTLGQEYRGLALQRER